MKDQHGGFMFNTYSDELTGLFVLINWHLGKRDIDLALVQDDANMMILTGNLDSEI